MQGSSRTAAWIASTAQDLRVALRRTRREPALTAAIILTIGLGLGAAATIFTAFRAALIQPPPFERPEQLVHLWERSVGTQGRNPTSYPTFSDLKARSRLFAGLEGYNPANLAVGVGDQARMLRGGVVTPGFFALLGVSIAQGRDFAASDDANVPAAAVVSGRFARLAAGDGDIVGRSISINGNPFDVIGVLPAEFHFAPLQDADIWLPLVPNAQQRVDRTDLWVDVVGRLEPGIGLPAARSELARTVSTLTRAFPAEMEGRTIQAVPLTDVLLGQVKPILLSLMGAVGLLLLAMCTNLAFLMLTRYLERAPELSLRTTLGATRGRIRRQLFTESLLVAAAGAAVAVALAGVGLRVLMASIPQGVRIDMPYFSGLGLDAPTIAFVCGLAFLLCLTLGLGPSVALGGLRAPSGGRTITGNRGQRRLRGSLVVAQLALTVVLLVAAGLLSTSFWKLLTTDLGIASPQQLVTARLSLSGRQYRTPEAQQRFYQDVLERVHAVPGVAESGLIDQLPLNGGGNTDVQPADQTGTTNRIRAALRIVAGDYFSAMRIPTLAGRTFDARDRGDARPAAVVSSELARRLGGEQEILGRRIRLQATGDAEWEVVGVAGEVQLADLDAPSPPAVYVPHLQLAENRMSLVLRTTLPTESVASAVRGIVRQIDSGVPVYAVSTLQSQMSQSRAVFNRRFPMSLCLVFAGSALSLALVAIYALCSHDVLARRREFGIRLALGATPRRVRAIVLHSGLGLAGLGVGLGSAGGWAASRFLESLLYGIGAGDWRVYAAVALGASAAACMAMLHPALRAGRVNPISILHE